MNQNKLLLSTLVLTGTLGLSVAPVWSQARPGDSPDPTYPGGKQPGKTEPGTQPSLKEKEQVPGKSVREPTNPAIDPERQPLGGQPKPGEAAKGKESVGERPARGMRGELAVDDIKKVQEALKDKGHDPGPVDGIVGPQTQKALRSFQVANGIRATGRVDAETAKALGMERGSSSKEPSMAPMTKEPSPKSK